MSISTVGLKIKYHGILSEEEYQQSREIKK